MGGCPVTPPEVAEPTPRCPDPGEQTRGREGPPATTLKVSGSSALVQPTRPPSRRPPCPTAALLYFTGAPKSKRLAVQIRQREAAGCVFKWKGESSRLVAVLLLVAVISLAVPTVSDLCHRHARTGERSRHGVWCYVRVPEGTALLRRAGQACAVDSPTVQSGRGGHGSVEVTAGGGDPQP